MIKCGGCGRWVSPQWSVLDTDFFGPLSPSRLRYKCPLCNFVAIAEEPAITTSADESAITPAATETTPPTTAGVIELSDYQPHLTREVMCWRCGHRWIAVHPEKTHLKELECPGCHAQGYAFATGQIIPNDILPEEYRDA